MRERIWGRGPVELVRAPVQMTDVVALNRRVDDAAILALYGLEPDPVIEAYRVNVDRTLLQQDSMRTPEERWRNIARATELAREMRRAGARRHG